MKKFISMFLLAVILLCSISAAAAYVVTMYAPDGRTISVYDYEVNAYKAVGWYDVPVSKIYTPDGVAAIINKTELQWYIDRGWKEDYTVAMYSLDGRQTYVWSTEVNNYKSMGWYDAPVSKIYSDNMTSAVVYKSELGAYINLGWKEDYQVTMYAVDGRTVSVWSTESDLYRQSGWYDSPVVRLYAYGGKICVVPVKEVGTYRSVGWYPLYDFVIGNAATELTYTFGTLINYESKFGSPVYMTNSSLGMDVGFVFNESGSQPVARTGFTQLKVIFPHLSSLQRADTTISPESLSSYFNCRLDYANGAYTFVTDGHTFHLSVNAYGNITMDSICAFE